MGDSLTLSERCRPAAVLAVSGWSGCGKTCLLEALVPRLRTRGLRVAVVKQYAHGVEIDRPGKDSDRLFQAGADVVLRSPTETVSRSHSCAATALERVLRDLGASHDLILVEGHKNTPLPKLWLLSEGETEAPSTVTRVEGVLAGGERRLSAAEEVIRRLVQAHHVERPLWAAILVGGASRRMGRAKQMLRFQERSFIERVVEAVLPSVQGCVLAGDGEVPGALTALPRLVDVPGVGGPIAGILAAQRWEPGHAWLVVACDLPLLEPGAVTWLLGRRKPGVWAVIPSLDGRLEPLLAVYEPQAVPLLEDLVNQGTPTPWRLIHDSSVICPETPAELRRSWRNFNTVEDLEALERDPQYD